LNEPGRITSQIISLLMEAELVIADLTTNNANVFYELSLRHAIGKPVIHMAAAGTNVSFDVRDNRTIFYTMHSREAEAAREELAKQIRHVRKPGYKAFNPILETVGIVNLENSNIPEKAAIGQLMGMVEGLNYAIRDIQRQMKLDALRASPAFAGLANGPIAVGNFSPNGTPVHSSVSAGGPSGLATGGLGLLSALFAPTGNSDDKVAPTEKPKQTK
jgi:hypothetical protein